MVKQKEDDAKRKDKDFIELSGIQKIKELQADDKYKVLEFLIKELMDIKPETLSRKSRRRSTSSSSSDHS